MDTIDKKRVFKIAFVSLITFLFAYSFDQYYIYKKELFFLSKPIQIINSVFNQ